MIKNKDLIKKSRYERKYIAFGLSPEEIEIAVRLNPFGFKEIFSKRRINSVYFDTKSFDSYYENLKGISNRAKVRIRWYGEDFHFLKDPQLEIKIKTGYLGRKISLPLQSFDLKDSISVIKKNIPNEGKISELLEAKIKLLDPVVLISYYRKYFISSDRRFRLTIDSNVSFYEIDKLGNIGKRYDQNQCVIEIKYDFEYDKRFRFLSGSIPFRLSRNSKYVSAIDAIYGSFMSSGNISD